MKQKEFFMIYKGTSIVRNCLRPESRPLNTYNISKPKKSVSLNYSNEHGM